MTLAAIGGRCKLMRYLRLLEHRGCGYRFYQPREVGAWNATRRAFSRIVGLYGWCEVCKRTGYLRDLGTITKPDREDNGQ